MAIAAPFALNVSPAAADGVGTASARGTDPDAVLSVGTFQSITTAQYSAITNCDEASNTRPFIVRDPAGVNVFRRTSTATSTCTTFNGSSVNQGTGAGTSTTLGPATLSWRFDDSPDNVAIQLVFGGGSTVTIAGAPQPLNGTPGGVWVFGSLPWPAGS